MKEISNGILVLIALLFFISCVGRHPDRFNTQRGAAIGAGFGALAGQLVGRNTKSTLIGAGVGTLVGAIVGNAVDQERQIAREAALTNRRVVYYDREHDHAIEAIPGPEDQHTKCRKVTKREWDKGYLVSERVEEICEGEKVSSNY
ncbi:MAG: glycine zipper 2TM domain-containing protein [Deltaproteobacteria bacterium]|nr:glycine zipper 2TM domain-containing protein [Deltaproteobacteria bacterium]